MAGSRRRPAREGRRTSNVAAAFITGTATALVRGPVAIVRYRVVHPTTSAASSCQRELARRRKQVFEADPLRHTYEET